MENETRERMMIAQRMGEGGWHVQVDSDEYFLDFGTFSLPAPPFPLDAPWSRPS
jgi:hypothetical protein